MQVKEIYENVMELIPGAGNVVSGGDCPNERILFMQIDHAIEQLTYDGFCAPYELFVSQDLNDIYNNIDTKQCEDRGIRSVNILDKEYVIIKEDLYVVSYYDLSFPHTIVKTVNDVERIQNMHWGCVVGLSSIDRVSLVRFNSDAFEGYQ